MSKKKMLFNSNQKTFQFTIKTDNLSTGSSSNNQFKLPLIDFGTVNFRVDWGDGSANIISVWNQTETLHTYASIGTYTIVITGTIRSFRFINSGDRLKMLNVSKVSALIINFGQTFFGCSNMTWTAIDTPVIETNQLLGTFLNCTMFNGNIESWNVSGVSNFNSMFSQCTNFNQPLNNWNMSSATTLISMFSQCTNFNQNLNSWNVSNATNMQQMFDRCTNFNQNLNSWNTSNVTSFNSIFTRCTNFNGNISSWNTSSATDMSIMFFLCSLFNQDISGWNTSNATTMGNMFTNATAFNQNIGSWNVSKVTNMQSMFQYATAFNQNIGGWDISKVTNFLNFMTSKTSANYSASNLDAIYNGWSLLAVKPSISINFGTIKYTASGVVGKSVLTSSPNSWTIIDGGI